MIAQFQDGSLYMPLEYQKAYEKGTRMYDGSVSPIYWQNHSEYNLKAKVDPYNKLLSGEGLIRYYNNSPDSISQVVFHTYPDYYKVDGIHVGPFGGPFIKELISDGMVIDELYVDNDSVDINDRKRVSYWGTNYGIRLAEKLAPNSSVAIRVKWHYTIPGKGFVRSGAIDSTSMFIGYWYPEIAVRDDINYWDRIKYNGSTEFYHDFSDYTVEIEVPENFIVWAPVPPENENQIYPDEVSARLEKAREGRQNVTIIGGEDYENGIMMRTDKWKYIVKNFPDFSFALSDHFTWKSCLYEDECGKFLLNIAYNPKDSIFPDVLEMQKESLAIFHNQFPIHPFPFEYFTVFDGDNSGGMEFPGMANNMALHAKFLKNFGVENVTDYDVNMMVTFHEMFHMYFPFLMGINEKKHAWMDEGWANYSENFMRNRWEDPWDKSGLGNLEYSSPIMVSSQSQPFHGLAIDYTNGSISYYSLNSLLGEELFIKCLNGYMDRWKYKHPTPYDFMFTFNDLSGKDLNWFWKRWYFDWGYADVSIKNFEENILEIENKGGRPLAFTVNYTFEDGTDSTEMISPEIWKSSTIFKRQVKSNKEIVSIELKTLWGHDAVKENSIWRKDILSAK